jgi:hypothetical protein
MWHLDETLGERTILPADTATLNFQNTNLVDGMDGRYNILGNLGAARLSRYFFDRDDADYYSLFLQPLSEFVVRPGRWNFTNSNIPYTGVSYYKAGDKLNGEERFKTYFSVNVNKQLAFGFNIDYLYGRGQYANQSTSHFNGGVFGSYIGERYQVQAIYNNYTLKMNENGGIADDAYITNPESMAEGKKEYEASNIPVRMEQTANRNKNFYVHLTHRYRLGFTREVKPDSLTNMNLDSIDTVEEFVPVTSFIHTFHIERSRHSFNSNREQAGMYENTYLTDTIANGQYGVSRDSTITFRVKNVLGVALLEGFNKYAKAGLTAYISHQYSRFDLMNPDSVSIDRYTEQEVFVGAELAKRQGRVFHYAVNGEVGVLDKALGQFKVNANLDLNFKLWKDTVNLTARGFIRNTLPTFYLRHYHSNHFFWDNDDFTKEFRTRVEGELNIDRWRTHLHFGVENIKNYTFLNQKGVPEQYGGNIQVMSATLKQDFKLGILHLDNEVSWQQSSNKTVLPLPQISLYSNLYLLTKLAKKVLTVQLGADVRYFTSYYAPAYTPAIQQFHLQSEDDLVKIGNYPIVNVYANLHLKRARFFVMYSHVNQGMGSRNYFMAPHYPINPRMLKLGIAVNFFD